MAVPAIPPSQVPRMLQPVALMHSQVDTTIRDLRVRMGEDVDLLSYLPDEKVRKSPFENKAAIGGYPLPVRILFGKIEEKNSPPRAVWVLLHNKPGSSRSPECRLRFFSTEGEPEESITLEESIDRVSPTAAFTCLRAQNGRLDKAHLSSVFRYYFILQKPELSSPWPISEIFISELKAACRIAKANAAEHALSLKSRANSVTTPPLTNNMATSKIQDSSLARATPTKFYTTSHKAIKGSRPGSAVPGSAKQSFAPLVKSGSVLSVSPAKQRHTQDTKPSLEELLFGEEAEATLLSQSQAGSIPKPTEGSCAPTLSPSKDVDPVSPEAFVASFQQNVSENEARETRLVENKRRQAVPKEELKDLGTEAEMLSEAIKQAKAERKRLRTTLSSRDLAFLQAGQDLAQEGVKRFRFDQSDEE